MGERESPQHLVVFSVFYIDKLPVSNDLLKKTTVILLQLFPIVLIQLLQVAIVLLLTTPVPVKNTQDR